jgi:hypothetical protein
MAEMTVSELALEAATNPALQQELKTDPAATLAKNAAAFQSDRKFYRIAIIGLISIIVLVIVSAIVVQIWKGEGLASWLSAVATTALGGLVGLFAPSPAES